MDSAHFFPFWRGVGLTQLISGCKHVLIETCFESENGLVVSAHGSTPLQPNFLAASLWPELAERTGKRKMGPDLVWPSARNQDVD